MQRLRAGMFKASACLGRLRPNHYLEDMNADLARLFRYACLAARAAAEAHPRIAGEDRKMLGTQVTAPNAGEFIRIELRWGRIFREIHK